LSGAQLLEGLEGGGGFGGFGEAAVELGELEVGGFGEFGGGLQFDDAAEGFFGGGVVAGVGEGVAEGEEGFGHIGLEGVCALEFADGFWGAAEVGEDEA
jgi:hypothetical protein